MGTRGANVWGRLREADRLLTCAAQLEAGLGTCEVVGFLQGRRRGGEVASFDWNLGGVVVLQEVGQKI